MAYAILGLAVMSFKLHQFVIPAEVLQRGFWLYVWQVNLRGGTAVHLGPNEHANALATGPHADLQILPSLTFGTPDEVLGTHRTEKDDICSQEGAPMNRRTGQRSRIWRLDMLTGLAFAVVCGLGLAAAETYPDRPIKLVVPFGAGGPPDVAARIVAGYLSTHLGALFIENRPGAGGTIAARAVAAMPPDGYSLMLATSGALSISPQLYHDAGYDPVKSFAPISLISTAPLVLAINAQMPIHNISELVAYAKSNPGKLNFGASIGTPPHISGEMFKILTGTNIVFVPYKTAAAAASDAIAGQIQMTFQGTTGIMPFVRTGRGSTECRPMPGRALSRRLARLSTSSPSSTV